MVLDTRADCSVFCSTRTASIRWVLSSGAQLHQQPAGPCGVLTSVCLLLGCDRAAVDAAEAADTGGYRGQWAALQRVDICDNQLSSAGGFEVMLALPSLAEVGVRGNPAFMGRHNAGRKLAVPSASLVCSDLIPHAANVWLIAVVRTLRQTFDTAGVNMNAGPVVPVPEQKMGTAYTAMAPSMVTVSDTLQQSEYATDVRLTLSRHKAHSLIGTFAFSDAPPLCSRNYGTSWTRRTRKTRRWETAMVQLLLQPGCRPDMNSMKRASIKLQRICEQPTTSSGNPGHFLASVF